MRVYLPATSALLQAWAGSDSAEPVDGRGFGVTPALREAYREGDLEELEWVAQVAAGEASLRLLAGDPGALPLRFVLAADVADADIAPATGPGHAAQLQLTAAVPRTRWASVLADDPGSAEDQREVATAAEALRRGDTPVDSVQDRLDDVSAIELGWFGVQEIPHLLASP